MRMRYTLATILVSLLAAASLRAADDDRIAKLEALVKAQGEQMKAQADQIKALQQKNAQYEAKASDIKMDASVQRAIDNAVSRAGTSAKYGGKSYLDYEQPDIKGTGLIFTGEFLYLKPLQSGQPFALESRIANPPAQLTEGKVKEVELNWTPGFRAGLGYRLPWDGWDLNAEYMYYHAEGREFAGNPAVPLDVLPVNPINRLNAVTRVTTIEAKLALDLDSADLLLGRTYKTSERTSVRLFGGLTAAWIKDWMSMEATLPLGIFGLVRSQWHDKVDWAGYGIKLGAEGDWKLSHGLRLFGRAAGSLLTGEFGVKHNEFLDLNQNGQVDPIELTFLRKTHLATNRIVPGAQIAAGVSWDHKLNERLNLKLSAGYELTNYFRVLQRQQNVDDVESSATMGLDGDLGLHGFVFKIKLDF